MDTWLVIGLVVLAFGAGYVAGKSPRALEPSPPDIMALKAVRPILGAEGKIAAIKAYREKTGAGLREAKIAVDTLDSEEA